MLSSLLGHNYRDRSAYREIRRIPMTSKQSASRRSVRGVIWLLVAVAALAILVTSGGFAYAANKETHDSFCASCHTQPESTYVYRSTDAQAADLASYHTAHDTRCIDCHSGVGVVGRVQAELLGAHNALAWYTHTADQPAHLTVPIHDANCLKCHQDVTQRGYTPKQSVSVFGGRGEEEFGNHWHQLLARWQASAADAGTCTSCHPGHSTEGTAETGFEDAQTTRSVCNACHRAMGD
jgi:nitrate/TMAO reductase-like tetraheme cytochrome c subunit